MTRSMARELGEKRIRINAIAPGLTRVEATEYVPAERHQLYENGRALTGAQQPEDVTGSVGHQILHFLIVCHHRPTLVKDKTAVDRDQLSGDKP